MFQQLNFRVDYNDADYSDLCLPESDKQILRVLAEHVAALSVLPVQDEKRRLWHAHNMLERTRPVVLCDPEHGWNEIILPEDIECVNSVARYWEYYLRKVLFWGERMLDDYVVEAVFDVPLVYTESPWTVRGSRHAPTAKKTAEDGKAYHIDTVLEDYSQIRNIVKPELTIDWKASDASLEIAREIFEGILVVRRKTVWFWSCGLTDDLVFLRGMEKVMLDFFDNPDGLHEIMGILLEGVMERLDWLESEGFLWLNNDGSYVGSGGVGFIDSLPAAGFAGKVRAKDMWALAESQAVIGISPEMFAEFIFPYQKTILERFGFACYGCCEPMDDRFDIVRQLSNLRRVSVSAWANRSLMAEKLGHKYIYSLKPNPALLAQAVMDEELVRKDVRAGLRTARDNCLELIMKDNHTIGRNPQNVTRWVGIVQEEIAAL